MNEKTNKIFDKLIDDMDKRVTVLITTIPQRHQQVLITIDSIYDQADEIKIVFNGYEKVPQWAQDAHKITPILDTSNKFTDSAKWQYVPDDGYVFTIDDDILYPQDYVSKMASKIEQYGRTSVMTVHGSRFQIPFICFGESKRSYRISYSHPKDSNVSIIGTGTLAFHLDTIRPSIKDFPSPSRSDIWFSALCIKNHVPMICIERGELWLKNIETDENTIWNMMVGNREFLSENTRLVRELIVPHVYYDSYGKLWYH